MDHYVAQFACAALCNTGKGWLMCSPLTHPAWGRTALGSSWAPTALSFRDAWEKDSQELGEWLQQLPLTLIIFPRATGPLLPYKRSMANLGSIKHDIFYILKKKKKRFL